MGTPTPTSNRYMLAKRLRRPKLSLPTRGVVHNFGPTETLAVLA